MRASAGRPAAEPGRLAPRELRLGAAPRGLAAGPFLPLLWPLVVCPCFPALAPLPHRPDPLLVRAARGERTPRAPAWMMRQAGRYMAAYQALALKHPSFRERSETTDLIVEISLQPFRAFAPDGVILFSDILTPLPAIGVPFEIDDIKGPILDKPCRTAEQVAALHELDLSTLPFVGDSLKLLRKEVGSKSAVLGFVGSPWTLATYVVEGGSSRNYQIIKV